MGISQYSTFSASVVMRELKMRAVDFLSGAKKVLSIPQGVEHFSTSCRFPGQGLQYR